MWTSTIDTTSSTGTATLKAALDPQNTGTRMVASAPAVVISFAASAQTLVYQQPLQLTWSASGATQCVASGGLNGDGWPGTLAAAGTQSVTEPVIASVTYTLTCNYPGGRSAKSSVTVNWVGPAPQVTFTATPAILWTTRPAMLSWTSNVAPCTLNGGTLSQDNLPASGSVTTTQAASGDVTYLLTCGPANDQMTVGVLVQYVTPAVDFTANGTDRRLGQAFLLSWQTFADTCSPSGGAPGDGWSTNSFLGGVNISQFAPQVNAAGTYTYTLTCSSGTLTEQQSATVTFENDAPYVTASLDRAAVVFSGSPADYVTLGYNSNLSGCSFFSTPALAATPANDPLALSDLPQGALTLVPARSGTYGVMMSCMGQGDGLSATSTPLTLTVMPPAPPTVSISLSPATLFVGQTFTASWSSNGTSSCTKSGGLPGDAWGGGMPSGVPYDAPAGSVTEVAIAGQFSFDITCQSIDPASAGVSAQAALTVGTLSANLSSSALSVTNGGSFTLTWSSTGASSCTALGGGANGVSWSGSLPASGSVTQKATTSGSFTYELECGVPGLESAVQSVTIEVSAGSSAGSSASGGGGGAVDLFELAVLMRLILRGRRRPKRRFL